LVVLTLRLLTAGPRPPAAAAEVLACAYAPDGAFVLTGGWDGQLRLWEASSGSHISALQASSKPISACAVAPDGRHWYSGSLDGFLACWDPMTHRQETAFLAHPRPLSAIVFGTDPRSLATASWDGNVTLWTLSRQQEPGRILNGHRDIVAGCRFTPDGELLASWSHDGTVRIWDVARGRAAAEWTAHNDRATAGSVSPDGRWVATGARNGGVRVWDLPDGKLVAETTLPAEVRGCLFLLDGTSLLAVDAGGRVTWHELPSLSVVAELATALAVQCAALAPASTQLCLGCGDGSVRFVEVGGLEDRPLAITAVQTSRRTQNTLQRLLGKSRVTYALHGTCPRCQREFDLPADTPAGHSLPCPGCQRTLQLRVIVPDRDTL
jgi:WD40 repeat protein